MVKPIITFADTETTGLLRPAGSHLNNQPYTIEVCAIQTNHKLKTIKEIDTLIRPPIPIPEHITRITGIDDNMVKGAPSFSEVFKPLKKMLKESDILVLQNYRFDHGMFTNDAARLGKKFKFPKGRFCTVEQSMYIRGRRLKLSELYQMATGKPEIVGAHRARKDTLATIAVYKWLMKLAKGATL